MEPSRPSTLDSELAALAPLADPVRRRLFIHVAGAGEAVSRDDAAAAAGISRSLAAFHLDRLVADGLLVPEYRRLGDRRGPGAGRPSKLYRRSPVEIAVEIPERRYALLAGWLADALGREPVGSAAGEQLHASAHGRGRELGLAARRAAGGRASLRRLVDVGAAILADAGYAAQVDERGAIRLANCPFDAVARDHRDLVCNEMNRTVLESFAAALGGDRLEATLDPREGRCCMVVRPVGPTALVPGGSAP
jgi:predicted ArsR family transcriptional regulator